CGGPPTAGSSPAARSRSAEALDHLATEPFECRLASEVAEPDVEALDASIVQRRETSTQLRPIADDESTSRHVPEPSLRELQGLLSPRFIRHVSDHHLQ